MLGKSAFYLVRMREPNLPIDPEASRQRFATCPQPSGNREGSTSLSVTRHGGGDDHLYVSFKNATRRDTRACWRSAALLGLVDTSAAARREL